MKVYGSEDLDNLQKLLFRHSGDGHCLTLSIGAPTSPLVSNILLYEFDQIIGEWCNQRDIIYTRYADDMTFSMKEKECRREAFDFVSSVTKYLVHPRLSLNPRKTLFCSKAGQRRVTGLIISNDGEVSLGRDKKRIIRSMLHREFHGKLDEKSSQKLRGLMNFAKNIDPKFIDSVFQKYPQLKTRFFG